MSFCARCGADVKGAAFCRSCGTAVAGGATAAPPSAVATSPSALAALPDWVRRDWPLTFLCSSFLIFLIALAGSVYGLGLGVASNGFRPSGFVGAVGGVFLGLAGLGADTEVFAQAGGGGVGFVSQAMSPTVLLGIGLIALALLRFARPRVAPSWTHQAAFVAKFAVVTSILLAIIGSFASIGDLDDFGDGFEVHSKIGSGESAWWILFLLLAVGGVTLLGWRRTNGFSPLVPETVTRAVSSGAIAAAAVVLVLGLAATVGGVIAQANSGRERIVAGIASPLVVANLGSAGHSVALGSSDGITDDPENHVSTHLSLFNWGFPPEHDDDGAPPWTLPLLVLAPLGAAIAAWQVFRRSARTTAEQLLGTGGLVIGGYAAASWLLALWAPFAVGGYSSSGGDGGFLGSGGIAYPSVGATLGLSLLWSLLGVGVAALLWATSHGIELFKAPGSPGTAAAYCGSCGAAITPGSAFCSSCGSPAPAATVEVDS